MQRSLDSKVKGSSSGDGLFNYIFIGGYLAQAPTASPSVATRRDGCVAGCGELGRIGGACFLGGLRWTVPRLREKRAVCGHVEAEGLELLQDHADGRAEVAPSLASSCRCETSKVGFPTDGELVERDGVLLDRMIKYRVYMKGRTWLIAEG